MTKQAWRMAIVSMLLAAAPGCGDEQPGDPLPSAPLDDEGKDLVSRRLVAPEAPCGYEWLYQVLTSNETPPERLDYIIEFDERGRAVLHEGRDDSGSLARSIALEYGGGPDWVHGVWVDYGMRHESWQTFDSFGRKVRYSADSNEDGSEDWVATYAYDTGGKRLSAHIEHYLDNPYTYDRAYLYDETERLIQIDRDDGPDGTTDQLTRVEYNEADRVIDRVTTWSDNSIFERKTARYDEANRLIDDLWAVSFPGTPDTSEQQWTSSFDSGGRLETEVFRVAWSSESAGVFESRLTRTYRYGDCR